jgi:ribosomal protein L37AE/L43A
MNILEKPVCAACGSDDIREDAYAVWDVHSQAWTLQTTFDDYVCKDCGGTELQWVEI